MSASWVRNARTEKAKANEHPRSNIASVTTVKLTRASGMMPPSKLTMARAGSDANTRTTTDASRAISFPSTISASERSVTNM